MIGKENVRHAFRTGLEKLNLCCDSPNTNLTPEEVIEIREKCILGSEKFGAKALAKMHGISDVAILTLWRENCEMNRTLAYKNVFAQKSLPQRLRQVKVQEALAWRRVVHQKCADNYKYLANG